MATIQKYKNTFILQYYLDGKRIRKAFPKGTSEKVMQAAKKRIESDIALHKLKLKRFNESSASFGKISLKEMFAKVLRSLEARVGENTLQRYELSARIFMSIIGGEMMVKDLSYHHLDQFKKLRKEQLIEKYQKYNWDFDDDKAKRGVNKELCQIRVLFRAAEQKGLITGDLIPRFEMYSTDRQRLPEILDEVEIIKIARILKGDYRLAFWILRYSGARRSEIVRDGLNAENGLKWQDINWIGNYIRVRGKGKVKNIPIHPKLKRHLLIKWQRLGKELDLNSHVVELTADAITHTFKRAMKQAGIEKAGSVHILRHTAASALLESGCNIRQVQEFLGHSSIAVTQIYTHVVNKELQESIAKAF